MTRLTSLSILTLALVLALLTVIGQHGLVSLMTVNREISVLSHKNANINAEITDLENRIFAVKNDPTELERLAREELGLSRPGEIVYTFPKVSRPAEEDQAVRSSAQ